MSKPFLRKLGYGARLTDEDCAVLRHLTRRTRAYEAGSALVTEDEAIPGLLVVLEGWAYHEQLTADGERQITDLMLPGDSCHPVGAMFPGGEHTLTTLTACRIALVDQGELSDVLARHAGVRRAIRWSALQVESILRTALTNNGRRQADQRIAHAICEIQARLAAIGMVEAGNSFPWPLTQENVANLTSLTGVHVNRTYKDLREAGLFALENRRMRVPDMRRLAAFCGFRPHYLHLSSGAAGSDTALPVGSWR